MFKVGDKVKLKDPRIFKLGSKICTITKIVDNYKYLYVTYKGCCYEYFPLKPCEVEKVCIKGQQLLFKFMV